MSKRQTWPPLAAVALGVEVGAHPTTGPLPKNRQRPRWRCHWCGELTPKAWAPTERHALACEARPAGAGGWIEVVL